METLITALIIIPIAIIALRLICTWTIWLFQELNHSIRGMACALRDMHLDLRWRKVQREIKRYRR